MLLHLKKLSFESSDRRPHVPTSERRARNPGADPRERFLGRMATKEYGISRETMYQYLRLDHAPEGMARGVKA